MNNKQYINGQQKIIHKASQIHNAFAMISAIIVFILFIDTYINLFATNIIYDLLQISAVGLLLLALFSGTVEKQNIYIKCMALIFVFNFIYYLAFYKGLSFLAKYSLLFMGFFPIILGIYFIEVPYRLRKKLMDIAYLLIVVTIITTIMELERNPYATKMMANPDFLTREIFQKNVGGYQFIYMLVCMVPLIIYKIKHANKKWFFIMLYILVLYTLFISQYATAFICMILFSIICFFMVSKGKVNILAVIVIIAFFCSLSALGVFSFVINKFVDALPSNMNLLADRIASLLEFSTGKDTIGAASDRFKLYTDSFLAFICSAGFGNMIIDSGYKVWGHSAIIDVFGKMGLLGGVMLFAICYYGVKYIYKRFSDKEYRAYFRMSLVSLLIVSLVDPTIGFPAITMAAFLFPVLMYEKEIA